MNAGRSGRILNDVREVSMSGRRALLVDLLYQPRDVFYWVLPATFLGDRLTSYGGYLRYSVEFHQGENARPINSADVKITGNGITIEHRENSQPRSGVTKSCSAQFVEVRRCFR